MNCKHVRIQGNTTKYYYCTLKNKAVDEYSCKSCMMRIPDLPDGFEKNIWRIEKMKVGIMQIQSGKAKKAVMLEMDMRDCIEIPLKRNNARHNRARLKENLRKCMENEQR